MNIIFVLLLAALMHAARSFHSADLSGSAGTLLAFGYVLLTGFFVGKLFKALHLPRLTGYIVTGIIVGPHGVGFLSDQVVQNLKLVNGVAVSLIALTAGCELELKSMRPYMRAIGFISLLGVGGTILLLSGGLFLGRGFLPFLAQLPLPELIALCLVLGVVLVAQSPAVVVALNDEMRADGPVSKTVLGLVVIADLLVILLFTVLSVLARSMISGDGTPTGAVETLLWEIPGSMLAGAGVAMILAVYLRRVRGGGALFVVTVAFVVAEVGQRMQLDPLVVALSAGVVIRNTTGMGHRLLSHIEPSSLPVYIVFFAVAGATIHLDALGTLWAPAALLVVLRAAGLLAGSKLGARLSNAPPMVQRFAGVGLLPQAGLAIALSMLFMATFPELGPMAGALTLSVVTINELLAPALYRLALVRAGEAGLKDAPPQEARPKPTGSEAPA